MAVFIAAGSGNAGKQLGRQCLQLDRIGGPMPRVEGMPMHRYYGWVWPMWGVMMLFWLLALAVAVSLAARHARSRGDGDGTGTARQILAERYARGELDADEYHRRLDNLR
ncbi:MAG TPA: SHOCT domain-containing protein [Micromonospora sp.]|nr:SHOCT domain-containing protein [Micromonospora sp.]